MNSCDVVIVGGGIAGSSLATALANDGLDVLLLEATVEYADRVRGESMVPWGVFEARELGVEDLLLAAGPMVSSEWLQYDSLLPLEVTLANPLPVGMMRPGVDGSLNLRHPVACESLADAASRAGANVIRGVTDVVVEAGMSPRVTATTADGAIEVKARLVVGADGRNSVVRRQVGIELDRYEATAMVAGLLLENVKVDDKRDFLAAEGDLFMAAFHQADDRLRMYLMPPADQRHRFSGPDGLATFRDAMLFSCLPFAEELGASDNAGPLATYPGDDTWTAQPFAPGVVLVGDAAGWNNPIIGQGLSIAMRDARLVRDIVREGDLSSPAFAPYGAERMERMRRLRETAIFATAIYVDRCESREARRAKYYELQQTDPLVLGMLGGLFAGPETGPPEAFDGRLTAAIRAAA
jgi:2-polyprenyl-6-methoxyphenol hydroxylase-like FAD-dependent oxidoreductase